MPLLMVLELREPFCGHCGVEGLMGDRHAGWKICDWDFKMDLMEGMDWSWEIDCWLSLRLSCC